MGLLTYERRIIAPGVAVQDSSLQTLSLTNSPEVAGNTGTEFQRLHNAYWSQRSNGPSMETEKQSFNPHYVAGGISPTPLFLPSFRNR